MSNWLFFFNSLLPTVVAAFISGGICHPVPPRQICPCLKGNREACSLFFPAANRIVNTKSCNRQQNYKYCTFKTATAAVTFIEQVLLITVTHFQWLQSTPLTAAGGFQYVPGQFSVKCLAVTWKHVSSKIIVSSLLHGMPLLRLDTGLTSFALHLPDLHYLILRLHLCIIFGMFFCVR